MDPVEWFTGAFITCLSVIVAWKLFRALTRG
jgi:hypothetical protein